MPSAVRPQQRSNLDPVEVTTLAKSHAEHLTYTSPACYKEAMPVSTKKRSPFLSTNAYALVATSPRLCQKLLPEGLLSTPYEILDNYRATLTLEDPEGLRATFRRDEKIRFLQDGVSGILDHLWGDGVVVTYYHNEAGILEDWFKDQGRYHFVIGLRRPMRRGEELAFKVERTAMVGFTRGEEWLETTTDHPARQIERAIVFPAERPCRRATLSYEGLEVPLPVTRMGDGRSAVRFRIWQPRVDTPYTARWSW